MWPFSRKQAEQQPTLRQDILIALRDLRGSAHKGQILDALPHDVARRAMCLRWAGEARNMWYEGRRQAIEDMLLSRDPRYKHMNAVTRKKIGEMKWGKSLQAKDFAGLEQMYGRWAQQYAGGPGQGN